MTSVALFCLRHQVTWLADSGSLKTYQLGVCVCVCFQINVTGAAASSSARQFRMPGYVQALTLLYYATTGYRLGETH